MNPILGCVLIFSIPFVFIGMLWAMGKFQDLLFPNRPGAKRPMNNG